MVMLSIIFLVQVLEYCTFVWVFACLLESLLNGFNISDILQKTSQFFYVIVTVYIFKKNLN